MNAQLYHLAFLHSSISSETNLSNERLEFLGDAVLSLVVADYLFQKFPFRNEGYLTDLRSKMVSRNNLNNIAHRMGIEEMLQYNKQDTFLNKKSISGNALEALIGAVYLDHGYAGAQKFIMNKIIAQHIDIEDLEASEFNYKSKILEWAQKNEVKIEFTVLEETRDKRHSFLKSRSWSMEMKQELVKTTVKKLLRKKRRRKVLPSLEFWKSDATNNSFLSMTFHLLLVLTEIKTNMSIT